MNRAEFIDNIAESNSITKKNAAEIVDTFVNTLTDILESGESVKFVGFGSFEVRGRAARKGVNPQNGEEITIQASKTVAFKPGKDLKSRVN